MLRRVRFSHGSNISCSFMTRRAVTCQNSSRFPFLLPASVSTPYLATSFRNFRMSVPLEEGDSSITKKKPVTNKESLKLALRFAWPQGRPDIRLRVFLSIVCVGSSKLLAVTVPFVFKRIIDTLTTETTLTVASTTTSTATTSGAVTTAKTLATNAAIVDPIMTGAALTIGVGSLIAAYVIVRVFATLTNELRHVIFARVSAHIHQHVTDVAVNHLQHLDLSFHVQKQSGAVLRIIERGCNAVTSLSLYTLLVLLPTAIEFTLVVGLLSMQVGWESALVSVSAVALYVLWTAKITKWRMKFRDEAIKLETQRGTLVSDSLLNYETVAYFNGMDLEAKRVQAVNNRLNNASVRIDQSMALLNVGQQLVFCVAGAASIGLAASGVLTGTMTVGDLVLVDALLLQLYVPLSWLGIVLREVVTNTQNFRELAGLLKEQSTLAKPVGEPSEMVSGTGSIELREVCFSVGDEKKPVLRNVSLTIPGGAFVGFCGPSGSGKSSILRLIFRFFDPDSGLVLVDGQDVRQVTVDSLRRRFAVVPQDVVLFNETVRYNIAYGRASEMSKSSDNEPSMAEIEEAAKQAHIHDALQRFPKGYDTIVGERGLRLSGGEKQRVSISRALLKDADIVLADEATSALDSVTEAEVVKKLRFNNAVRAKVVGGAGVRPKKRTLVCVAHRLSTIKDCDIIFVLNSDGQLAEQGTHDELLEKNGLYATLWHKQQKRKEAGDDDVEANEEAEGAAATSTTPSPPPAAAAPAA